MAITRYLDFADSAAIPEELYSSLDFPEPPADRPYVYLNMVSTVDGKIIIGPPGSTARGVGGATDQMLMRRLQINADMAIVGSGTLRAGPVIYPAGLMRAVVTQSGDLPFSNRFFTDAHGKAIVFAPESLPSERRAEIERHGVIKEAGSDTVDVAQAVRILRREYGTRKLLLEGGATLNSDFFLAGLVDELFITIAPKVKGGAHLPSPVEGPGFPNRSYAPMKLLSIYGEGDELYLRYRVRATESDRGMRGD